MNTKKPKNSYDETKKMLNTIRKFQASTKPHYGVIEEQAPPLPATDPNTDIISEPSQGQSGEEGSDFAVINDVEVVIHSEDPEDLDLNDEEKGKISQLIDDFRVEVVETVEFDKLHVYETSAKLDGKIGEVGLAFTLSTGDDTGLYINGQMLKIDENSLNVIRKLGQYHLKFSSTINDLLVTRKTT